MCSSGLFTIDLHLMQLGVFTRMQRRKRYTLQISIMHVCVDNFSPWRRCHESRQSYERVGRDACMCVPEGMHWGKHVSSNFLNHLVPKAYAFMAAPPYHAANDKRPGASFYHWTLLIQSSVTYTSEEKSILMKTASSVPCSCMQLQHCIPFQDAWDTLKLQT